MTAPLYERRSPASGLWSHLLRKTGGQQAPLTSTETSIALGNYASHTVAPLDKAGTSTRILLHDTQAHLEKFTDHVSRLAGEVHDAKRELVAVQQLYQDEHEQLVERMIGLANRCQTELQKTMGTPAQSADVRGVSKDFGLMASRLEALDKKLDALNSLNQTQSQALQAMQEQQCQILTALLPILPTLQSIPLHVETARNQVKDSISELRQDFSACRTLPVNRDSANLDSMQQSGRTLTRSINSNDLATSPSKLKRRRVDDPSLNPATHITATPNHSLHVSTKTNSIQPPLETPSPEVTLSKFASRAFRKSTSRVPLADLVLPEQRCATPTIDIIKDLASLTHGGVPRSSGASRAAPSAHNPTTPSGRALSSQLRNRATLASTPSRVTGSPNILLSALKLAVPHAHGSTPQTPRAHLVHNAPIPDLDLRRTTTVHSSSVGPVLSDRALQNTERSLTPLQLSVNDMGPPSVPSSTSKPMSLKDRRALFSDDSVRTEGKRFIPLDDEDDEDEMEVV